MRLLDVRLQNITCFVDLYLDFRSTDSNEPAPWVVLLGENGTGKSTILQMIGAAVIGVDRSIVAGDIDWKGYVREKTTDLSSVAVTADNRSDSCSFTLYGTGASVSYESEGRTFACGYSPWRRLIRKSRRGSDPFPILDDSAPPFRFATLFGDESRFTPVSSWLAGLYFSSIHPEHTENDARRYSIAKSAVLAVLPNIRSLDVSPDLEIIVEEHGRKIPIERLSDGYRGTLAWVGDLIRRLFDAYPDSDNPLHERGVVLVDEIDLHLHPKWQRSIVSDIRKLFPNLQFIVTTHSPFIAQGLQPEDKIIVLERSARKGVVTAREDSGALESWSADQIYSSYFGLKNGTRGKQTQRRESRYERLLDLEARGELDEAGQSELSNLRSTLDKARLGATQAEDDLFKAAETIASELQNRLDALESPDDATGELPVA